MGSDYERWKKRREAERARREAEERVPARPPRVPAPYDDASSPTGAARGPEGPRRTYQGYVPPPAQRGPAAPRDSGRGRGCAGCFLLALGALLLLGLTVLIGGSLYWKEIEQRGQINVLVLGVDERPAEPPPFRSDTIILTGFDPVEREVALLSIPRDLWLSIPGQGENRINTAHFFGGAELAKQTVRENFGVPVQYYVKLNFDGFTRLIDAMGGITVDVPEPLHDENYPTPDYGITTVDIPAGIQEMDGATALIYARSRYSTNDFDRSRRQQDIIGAVRTRLAQPSTWSRFPAIYGVIRSTLTSDVPQSQWPALALILLRSDIERAAIGPEAVREFFTNGGAQVLEPIWEQINPTLARYFE